MAPATMSPHIIERDLLIALPSCLFFSFAFVARLPFLSTDGSE
jgi:hypothetical protein